MFGRVTQPAEPTAAVPPPEAVAYLFGDRDGLSTGWTVTRLSDDADDLCRRERRVVTDLHTT